jgi:CheY-like chemotaxis protein
MLRQQHLFLVDDDADDQEIFKSALANVDDAHTLVTANNGHDALNLLSKGERLPDYIFVDLNMPRMNGLQFLKEVKKTDLLRHIPVIVFTTSSNPRDMAKANEAGAERFITKPARFTDLCSLLQSILAHPVNSE